MRGLLSPYEFGNPIVFYANGASFLFRSLHCVCDGALRKCNEARLCSYLQSEGNCSALSCSLWLSFVCVQRQTSLCRPEQAVLRHHVSPHLFFGETIRGGRDQSRNQKAHNCVARPMNLKAGVCALPRMPRHPSDILPARHPSDILPRTPRREQLVRPRLAKHHQCRLQHSLHRARASFTVISQPPGRPVARHGRVQSDFRGLLFRCRRRQGDPGCHRLLGGFRLVHTADGAEPYQGAAPGRDLVLRVFHPARDRPAVVGGV